MIDRTKVDQLKKELFTANDLQKVDFTNEDHKLALLEVCELNEEVRNGLSVLDSNHCAILVNLVKKNYRLAERFIPEQLTEDVVLEYLNRALLETDVVNKFPDAKVASPQKRYSMSRDGYPIIKLNYQTTDVNAIFYEDNDLHLVTYLLSNIDLYVKITKGLDFFKFLDCALYNVNMEKVMETLRRYLLENVREVLTNMVVKKKIGFFHFAGEFKNIENDIKNGIDTDLGSAGISVVDCNIKYVTIPENVIKEVQSQSFILSKTERDKKALIEYEEKSLAVFEKKLEAMQKYGFDDGLTEAEKDNAFDRYIAKVNNLYKQEKFEVERPEAEKTELYGNKSLTRPITPIEPLAPAAFSNILLIIAAVLGVLGLIVTVLSRIESINIPQLLYLGICLIVVGIILIVVFYVNKSHNVEARKRYEAEMTVYKTNKEKYAIALAAYEQEQARFRELNKKP